MHKTTGWLSLSSILLATALGLSAQTVAIVRTSPLELPGVADSNSPSHWSNGKLILFNSDGMPVRSQGSSLETLGKVRATRFYSYEHAPLWIEATWKAPNGQLYAWYHHEVFLHCEDNPVSAPSIGALRSDDDGITFEDLGIVLSAAGDADCQTSNQYFGGGNGDFSVIADREGKYLYFLYSNYSGGASSQGVAIARMKIEDRDLPAGNVFKYFSGNWEEPGQGGNESPIFAAATSWASANADAFWGPSIHWNTYLNRYVMLLNHACCDTDWPQEGIYVSFSADLSHPETWLAPVKIFEGGGWYPMAHGLEADGTDKQAGRTARFFQGSHSEWLLEFRLP